MLTTGENNIHTTTEFHTLATAQTRGKTKPTTANVMQFETHFTYIVVIFAFIVMRRCVANLLTFVLLVVVL